MRHQAGTRMEDKSGKPYIGFPSLSQDMMGLMPFRPCIAVGKLGFLNSEYLTSYWYAGLN